MNLRQDYLEDHDISDLVKSKDECVRPTWSEISYICQRVARHNGTLSKLTVEYCIESGSQWIVLLLSCRRLCHRRECQRFCVRYTMWELHGRLWGGHLGIKKMMWRRWCDMCIAVNVWEFRSRKKMQQYNVGSPFERFATDVGTPIPEIPAKKLYLLVVIDLHKMTRCVPNGRLGSS